MLTYLPPNRHRANYQASKMIHHFIPWSEAILPPRQTLVPLNGKFGILRQLPPPQIIWLDEIPSTHTYLKSGEAGDLAQYTMVCARRQTAGRGQRGNTWESEDYKNLTFSLPFLPSDIRPADQFIISEAFALSIVALLQEEGISACVKWPNDIYVGERKICGILIDHALCAGEISRSILSAGLNINQLAFNSDAPNPCSMLQVIRRTVPDMGEYDVERLAIRLLQIIRQLMEATRTAADRETIHRSYMRHLFRHDGRPHLFYDRRRDQKFAGIIRDVLPDGPLVVEDTATGVTLPAFLFKEIAHLPEDDTITAFAADI